MCKARYPIFPSYFKLWGSQDLCSFFRIHLREGCKNVRKTPTSLTSNFVKLSGVFLGVFPGGFQKECHYHVDLDEIYTLKVPKSKNHFVTVRKISNIPTRPNFVRFTILRLEQAKPASQPASQPVNQ